MTRLLLLFFLIISSYAVQAQNPLQRMPGGALLGGSRMGGGGGGGGGPFKDSLLHRTGLEDSLTLIYRYLDTARFYSLDSSVNDFSKRWHVPWSNIVLGNTGGATRSLLFSPTMKAGWDHGFHAYDEYISKVEQLKFYNTTRPYTQLDYVLGPNNEQNIGVLHTQNIRYNWNFAFNFKLINSPGIFRNQKNSHTNLNFNTWYTSPKRRYTVYFIAANNRIGATENGGIQSTRFLDSLPFFSERFSIPTNLGGVEPVRSNFLSNTINTGNRYTVTNFLVRHHYDLGKKDSVVTDSSVVYFFYPRFRFQHTMQFDRYSLQYLDTRVDTAGYKLLYGLSGLPATFGIKDYWQTLTNEAAIYSFPDIKNQQQFIKAAAGYQFLEADFGSNEPSFTNIYLNGEYRNKTKNKKWDMELAGTLYMAGFNSGDYSVIASLKRLIGQKLGYLSLGFRNVSRTPSFIHDDRSNFKKFNLGNTSFGKENTTIASATYELPQQRLKLGANYFLASNYIYFKDYTQAEQEATLFNVLQLQLEKQFRLWKHWNWYTEVHVQQATANAPVNLPLVFTRNRFAFEGKFFKTLNLSTGVEMRYHTAYKADSFSPVLGQFFLQNTETVRNLPDIAAYVQFRIRSLTMIIRAENLNTVQTSPSFSFLNNNLATPLHPTPGFFVRFGLYWGFVN
ncbi:putative porin [Lacibacter sp. H407]|uniref:putative porin n=1 Tax=Lacibacter sp. H407 TaxID=3133423 RepID=UPI0030BD0942